MGLFKSMKDMAEVTKSAKQMREQQQRDAGYKPGLGGSMAQMGDMLGQANEQLKEMTGDQGERDRLLAEGIDGQGVIVGMGTPRAAPSGSTRHRPRGPRLRPRGLSSREPVHGARLSHARRGRHPATQGRSQRPGEDRDRLGQRRHRPRPGRGAHGERRQDARARPAPSGGSSGGGDTVTELERLAKLRDSGALTDAEFEQQKARILGG